MSTPILKVRGADGTVHDITAIVGPRGPVGPPGPVGPSPKVGVDYFTAEDKQEIVAAVLANFTDVSEVGL